MIFDAGSRHALGIRDGGVIPVDEDACLGDILREIVPRPKGAILVRPCLKWVVVFASRVQAVDEDETTRLGRLLLCITASGIQLTRS